ncbi:MAG: hypothetical protein ACXABY_12970 [Candidatus Thorarchaeota archaeon]|jgi:hypothetical protein
MKLLTLPDVAEYEDQDFRQLMVATLERLPEPTSIELNDLADVNVPNLSDGDFLVWDASENTWVPGVAVAALTFATLTGNGALESTILMDTLDTSDTKRLVLGGGGAALNTRGAYLMLHGNEYTTIANYEGALLLVAGNSGAGNTFSDQVVVDGDALIPFSNNSMDLGTAAKGWQNFYAKTGIFTPQLGPSGDADLITMLADALTVNGSLSGLDGSYIRSGSAYLNSGVAGYLHLGPNIYFTGAAWVNDDATKQSPFIQMVAHATTPDMRFGFSSAANPPSMPVYMHLGETALYPDSDSAISLGLVTRYWSNAFIDQLYVNNQIGTATDGDLITLAPGVVDIQGALEINGLSGAHAILRIMPTDAAKSSVIYFYDSAGMEWHMGYGASGTKFHITESGVAERLSFADGTGDATLSSGIIAAGLKSGTTQALAGAAANELWVDTNDDYTVKRGT